MSHGESKWQTACNLRDQTKQSNWAQHMAIIVCNLILSLTGNMPTRRTYKMISFYLTGWASVEELEAHIEKLQQVK